MKRHRFLAVIILLLPTIANAASVIKPIVGCRAEPDSKKVADFIAKNDNGGLDKFSAPKLASRDCFSLLKGMAVDVDKKDGQLLCVRPTGGFDCYWTIDAAINQNPASESETHGSSPSGKRNRGVGNQPPS